MSGTIMASNIETVLNTFNHLVMQMFSSNECVKCVSCDGSDLFTADVEILLSHLDIEHPVGELVVQILKSHKHEHGTGTKTLLYMISSLAKTVSYLSQLGISSKTSLAVIRDAISELSLQVQEIAVPVKSMTAQFGEEFGENLTCDNSKGQTASDSNMCESHNTSRNHEDDENIQNRTPSQSCNEAVRNKTDDNKCTASTVLNCMNDKISGDSLCVSHSKISSYSENTMHLDIDNDVTVNSVESLNVSDSPLSPNVDQQHPKSCTTMLNFAENIEKFSERTDNKQRLQLDLSSETTSSEADPVYLKMSNALDTSEDDDISWFFDVCSFQSHSNKECEHKTAGDILAGVKSAHCLGEEANITVDSEGSSGDSQSGGTDVEHKDIHSIMLTDSGVSSLKDVDQHDSDFEDCFDDVDNRKHFHLTVEPIPSTDIIPHSMDTSFMDKLTERLGNSQANAQILAMHHNVKKHYYSDIDFDEGSQPMSFEHQVYNGSDNDCDEFDACFTNTSDHSQSVAENYTIKRGSSDINDKSEKMTVSAIPSFSDLHKSTGIQTSGCRDKISMDMSHLTEKTDTNGENSSEIKTLNKLLNNLKVSSPQIQLSSSSRHFQQSESLTMLAKETKDSITVVHSNSHIKHFSGHNNAHSETLISEFIPDDETSKSLESASDLCSHSVIQDLCLHQNNVTKETKTDSIDLEVVSHEKECTDIQQESNLTSPASQTKLSETYIDNNWAHEVLSSNKRDEMGLDKKLELLLEKRKKPKTAVVFLSSRHLNSRESSSEGSSPLEAARSERDTKADGTHLSDLKSSISHSVHPECRKNPQTSTQNTPAKSSASPHFSETNPSKDFTVRYCATAQHVDQPLSFSATTCSKNSFSEEVTSVSVITLPQQIQCLHGCHEDIIPVAKQLFLRQLSKSEQRVNMMEHFNIHLVDCVLSSSSALSSSSSLSSRTVWTPKSPSITVVPGLVIPCSTDALEHLDRDPATCARKTLLINGDLTPGFHHKGYKPTLNSQIIIAASEEECQENNERVWCSGVISVIKQLNVTLLLVKGKVSDVLAHMCAEAGVLLLAGIMYHTLSVLAHLHGVDMLTYITQALEANVCSVSIQPLSSSWKDQLGTDTTFTHYATITNTTDVQTVILHSTCAMSAQLFEERLWKCLHSIRNAQEDEKVLPGSGLTEQWCADKLYDKAACALDGHEDLQHSVILDGLAKTFQDYASLVTVNTEHSRDSADESCDRISYQMSESTSCCSTSVSSHEGKNLSDSNICAAGDNNVLITNCKGLKSCDGSVSSQKSVRRLQYNAQQSCQPVQQETTSYSLKTNQHLHSANREKMQVVGHACKYMNDSTTFDNFRSKVSAWNTAVDVVSTMQGLGLVVTTGVDGNMSSDFIVL